MGSKKKKRKPKHRPLPLRLKLYRERLGWSQAKLAEEMGTSDATIARIEGGKQNWQQETLQEAAAKLGVHWLALLPVAPEVMARFADDQEEDKPLPNKRFPDAA